MNMGESFMMSSITFDLVLVGKKLKLLSTEFFNKYSIIRLYEHKTLKNVFYEIKGLLINIISTFFQVKEL